MPFEFGREFIQHGVNVLKHGDDHTSRLGEIQFHAKVIMLLSTGHGDRGLFAKTIIQLLNYSGDDVSTYM